MLAAQVGVIYFLGLYEPRALGNPRAQAGTIAAAAGLQALVLIAVYFFRQDLVFPRSIFVVFAGLNAALLFAWRLGSRSLMGAYPRRRVLVVGTNAAAAEVIDTIRVQHWLGMDIVGAVSGDGASPAGPRDVPLLGPREELPALCARHDVDEVIIASEHSWQDRLLDSLSRPQGPRARVCVVPSPYEILIGRPEHLRLHDIPLIEVIREPATGGASAAKRLFDVVLALVLLVAALPVMLLVALAIRLTSRGPVLYTQSRVGKDGRPFTMVKFRTMHFAAERTTGPVLAAGDGPLRDSLRRTASRPPSRSPRPAWRRPCCRSAGSRCSAPPGDGRGCGRRRSTASSACSTARSPPRPWSAGIPSRPPDGPGCGWCSRTSSSSGGSATAARRSASCTSWSARERWRPPTGSSSTRRAPTGTAPLSGARCSYTRAT